MKFDGAISIRRSGPSRRSNVLSIIVNDDAVGVLPLKVIVPLTDWKGHYSVAAWMVRIDPTPTNGVQKTSAADCFQVRSVSQQRLTQRVGRITDAQMEQIGTSLKTVLHLT